MRVLYVDDERSAHTNFNNIVEKRKDIRSIKYCFDYESAIAYAKENKIDCAFLDISLTGKNGIELAKELCSIYPKIELAFVTSYPEFTSDAYKVGGRAYITKPYSDIEIEETLDVMKKLVFPENKLVMNEYDMNAHIFAKTFGNFDFIVDGIPIYFKNKKSKELLAFLVHQMGGTVSSMQIFYALWEDNEYTRSTSTYVRRTVRALKDELEELGIGDILLSKRNSLGLNFRLIACDAYEMMHGNELAKNKYAGEYMSQYSWGETLIPSLDKIINKDT